MSRVILPYNFIKDSGRKPWTNSTKTRHMTILFRPVSALFQTYLKRSQIY